MARNLFRHKKIKREKIPSYLVNLVNAVMELHEVTETLKSRGVIQLKSGKGTTKKTEAISGYWLYRKKGVYDECREIRYRCTKLSRKIRFWLGYYDDY